MRNFFTKIKTWHVLCLGIVFILISWIPTLLLGTNSIIPYHDQLDGEIIAYIYQAKYMFSDINYIPEFLNGAPKTALTPPAPFAVLLFYFFTPFIAYIILQFSVQIIAYCGMFFLAKNITQNHYIALIVAIFYTFLPFLPVYGLAHYGAPLLLLSFWNLYKNQKHILSYIYIVLYAGMSSLALIGFAWITFGLIILGIIIIKKTIKPHKHFIFGLLILLFVYLSENITLILQILGLNNGFVSHKSEYTLNSVSFITKFWEYLRYDSSHVPDCHNFLLPVVVGTIILSLVFNKQLDKSGVSLRKWLILDLLGIITLYAISALWDISPIVELRRNLDALGAVQLSRFVWTTPVFWYIALALSFTILFSQKVCLRWFQYIFATLSILFLSFTIFKSSLVKPCAQELLLTNYENISWKDYYALDIMEQVEHYIFTEENLQIHEYKVASLGIDPCAALYHGFYCVDGYSNNYPLEYKLAFRSVIASELAKSDWLRSYYDDWGNRCYLHAVESQGYFNIEKGTFYYTNLEIDTYALHELGCDYILSAAYIVQPEEMNLTLLNEQAIDAPESYYNIYIYKINQ